MTEKTGSPTSALRIATDYLAKAQTDVSLYDISKPEAVQKIEYGGATAWRVSWNLRNVTGKGGQLVVIVNQSGVCEQGWGD